MIPISFLQGLVAVFVLLCLGLPVLVIGLEVWDAHKARQRRGF